MFECGRGLVQKLAAIYTADELARKAAADQEFAKFIRKEALKLLPALLIQKKALHSLLQHKDSSGARSLVQLSHSGIAHATDSTISESLPALVELARRDIELIDHELRQGDILADEEEVENGQKRAKHMAESSVLQVSEKSDGSRALEWPERKSLLEERKHKLVASLERTRNTAQQLPLLDHIQTLRVACPLQHINIITQ